MDSIQQAEVIRCLRAAVDDLESFADTDALVHPVLAARVEQYRAVIKILDDQGL